MGSESVLEDLTWHARTLVVSEGRKKSDEENEGDDEGFCQQVAAVGGCC